MEVYTGDSDSPTKCQKHDRNSGVAIGAIISGPLLVAEPSSPKKKRKVNNMTNIKMMTKTVASFLMISKNIIYPSLLSSSSSLGNHEYSPCLHEFFTVSTEISFSHTTPTVQCPFSCVDLLFHLLDHLPSSSIPILFTNASCMAY